MKDIKNSIFHVLGQHERCAKDFCTGERVDETHTLTPSIMLKIKVIIQYVFILIIRKTKTISYLVEHLR